MIYFQPNKKNASFDVGRGRKIHVPMSNVIEINVEANTAKIKAITGAVMIYYGGGKMNINDREIQKIINNKGFNQKDHFNFIPI